VIDLAASTFQISPSGLLDAINELKTSSRLLAPSELEEMSPKNSSGWEKSASEAPQASQSSQQSLSPNISYNPPQLSPLPAGADNSLGRHSSDARTDALFGFKFGDSIPWGNCFAGMLPLENQMSPSLAMNSMSPSYPCT
jgi:hypothetical protein